MTRVPDDGVPVVVLEPDEVLTAEEAEVRQRINCQTRPCSSCGAPVVVGADAALLDAINLFGGALRALGAPIGRAAPFCEDCR